MGFDGTDYTVQNDYDGDGKCDIAVWRDSTGGFYVNRSSDNGFLVMNWGTANDLPIASYDSH